MKAPVPLPVPLSERRQYTKHFLDTAIFSAPLGLMVTSKAQVMVYSCVAG